jgi:hypothetical protein
MRPAPLRRTAPALLVALLLTYGGVQASAQQPAAPPAAPALSSPVSPDDTVKVDRNTEAVINGALKYLAAQQLPDGSWSGDKNDPASSKYAVAMTAYVMMSFLANGNLPNGGLYAKQVKNGLQFLLDAVQPDGMFNEKPQGQYMYSHGLGTMVLAEIYGENQDPAIRTKLEHVVVLILRAQNPEGGWRYQPGSRDADISVTVPQTVALCAAKRAGIEVPQVTIDRAVAYIKKCSVGSTGGFAYQVGKGGPGFARTAAAIYALQITGLYDDPMILPGSKFVMTSIDRCDQPGWTCEWLSYGNYYAAVAHYLIGGDKWKTYYSEFGQHYLLSHVSTQGDMKFWDQSLDPRAKGIGSNWVTAVATVILSLPYGYLPLYQR